MGLSLPRTLQSLRRTSETDDLNADEIAFILSRSTMASSTIHGYISTFKSYASFCISTNRPPLPFGPSVSAFLATHFEMGLRASSLSTKLSGLLFCWKLLRLRPPSEEDMEFVRAVVKGGRHLDIRAPKRAEPFRSSHIIRVQKNSLGTLTSIVSGCWSSTR